VDKIDSMRLLVRLADLGSFSRAAEASGISQSAVSKELSRVESALGVQLLRRTTRGLSLTEAGAVYVDAIRKVLQDIEDVETRLSEAHASPSGLLRVAMSASFGRLYVTPHLSEFFSLYPDVQIDFEMSDRNANLVAENIDLAIRIGALADSQLVARRIGRSECITVGSPSYFALYGVPSHPLDAASMPCVVSKHEGASRTWRFSDGGEPVVVEPLARLRANDADHVLAAVVQGVGMGHAPSWLFAEELTAGRLIRVLGDFSSEPVPISVVTPPGRRAPRKAQVFIDFLARKFSETAELRVPETASS